MKKSYFAILSVLFCLLFFTGFGQSGMIVHPGTDVTVGTGTTLDIGGDRLLLQDDHSSAPSFLQKGSLTFSGGGKSFVEQYLVRDVWHMASCPVTSEVLEVYLWKYVERFHESNNTWEFLHLPLSIPLILGEGLFIWNYTVDPNATWPSSGDSVVFDGTLNFQDVPLTLSNTPASTASGWNLIGNPYPVALEWNGHADWNLNNVGVTNYIYDNTAGGSYLTWNYLLGTGTNPNGGYIAATQGFWVRAADTNGVATSLTIPESQRVHNNAAFLKNGNAQTPEQLLIKVEGNGNIDRTIIGFYEKATQGFDPEYDGYYLSPETNNISVYSVVEGTKYALNELPSTVDNPVVALNFTSIINSTYSLSFDWLDRFPADLPLFLEDKQDRMFQDLRQNPVYSFASSPADDPGRFAVHFAFPDGLENKFDFVHIYSYENTVYVNIPFEIDGLVQVYDMTGRLVFATEAQMGINEYAMPNTSGNCIVRLVSNNGVKSEKVHLN